MKTGKTLVELAQEIERQRDNRVDMVAPTSALTLMPMAEADVIAIRALLMTDRFTKLQIAEMFGVSDGLVSHIEYGRAWAEVGGTPWFQPNRIKRSKETAI